MSLANSAKLRQFSKIENQNHSIPIPAILDENFTNTKESLKYISTTETME